MNKLGVQNLVVPELRNPDLKEGIEREEERRIRQSQPWAVPMLVCGIVFSLFPGPLLAIVPVTQDQMQPQNISIGLDSLRRDLGLGI